MASAAPGLLPALFMKKQGKLRTGSSRQKLFSFELPMEIPLIRGRRALGLAGFHFSGPNDYRLVLFFGVRLIIFGETKMSLKEELGNFWYLASGRPPCFSGSVSQKL